MQINTITDIITHFVGLLHIDLDPDRNWSRPDGARSAPHSDADSWAHLRSGHQGQDVATNTSGPSKLLSLSDSTDKLLHGWKGSIHHLPGTPQLHLKPIVLPQYSDPQVPSGASFPDGVRELNGIQIVSDPIWQGADQTVADNQQANMLFNNTAYVDHLTGGPLPIPGDDALPGLLDQARAAMPDEAPALGQSATHEVTILTTYEDGLASARSNDAPHLQQGTWVDGLQTSTDGSPVALTLPVDYLSFDPPTAQGVPLGQTIVSGGDVAGNVALIQDFSAAPLTTIVQGSAYHADLIVQINVVQNIDAIATNLPAGLPLDTQGVAFGDNVVHNTAHFEQLPDVISATVSGSLGQSWNVQVVNGDFYDINAITQQNALINDTLYVGAPQTDHYFAVLGGDTQLNQFEITHDAPVYDLLIVLGNSYTANAICQENILLNDTKAGVTFALDAGGTNSLITGHDSVTNDASITEIGQTVWNPTTPELQALVHSLATEGNGAAAFPGLDSLGTTVNVMIVTGNYYNFNLMSQTNIVANSNAVLADLSKAGSGVPATVVVGQDTLSNSGAIVTAGALNHQYVAGQQYETSMLVQTNLVTSHADVSTASPNALVPELVAFLDTGTGHDATAPSTTASAPTTVEAAHHDLLASTLT